MNGLGPLVVHSWRLWSVRLGVVSTRDWAPCQAPWRLTPTQDPPLGACPPARHQEASPSPKPVQLGDRSRRKGEGAQMSRMGLLSRAGMKGDWTKVAVRWERAADP